MDNLHIAQSQAISICNRYNLKQGVFNPIQNSPPNIWRSRLMQRVNTNIPLNTNILFNSNTLTDIKVAF